jgi:transposase
MNQPLDLPGFPAESSLPPKAKIAAWTRPRVKPINRSQMIWRSVDVEHLIEEDHPARAIWAFVGPLALESFYAPIEAVEGAAGRTPWDPRLLVSLWIYAYSRGISSAREIERRCSFDPGFQWLCGMEPINHHTLSDFRVAHDQGLQEFFMESLGVLSAAGLISLKRVMHDGSKVKASASSKSFRREDTLRAHLEAARAQVQKLAQDQTDERTREQAAAQRAAREREQRVAQALKELEQIRTSKRGTEEKEQARASGSDPEARVMKQADGGYAPSYNVQISTEASHKIIVGVGISQNSSDYAELAGAVAHIEQNLAAKPDQLVVDGGFTSRENILMTASQGIDLIGSFGDQEAKGAWTQARQGTSAEFSKSAFEYHASENIYGCPAGQPLRPIGHNTKAGAVQHVYRAEASTCHACAFKAQCCPQTEKGRTIVRVEEALEVQAFRQKMQTAQSQEIYRQRAEVAEFPNAWIKEKLGLRRFRVRGLAKVGCEALWACLTYNIQQWIRLCWRPKLEAAQT